MTQFKKIELLFAENDTLSPATAQQNPEWTNLVRRRVSELEDPSQEIIQLFTSGSTGKPKEILAHKTHLIEGAKRSLEIIKPTPGRPFLLAIPPRSIGGLMVLVRALVVGAPVIAIEPRLQLTIPKDIKFATTSISPAQLQRLLDLGFSFDQFESVLVGGGRVTPSIYGKISRVSTKVFETFGMTETLSHIGLREIKAGPAAPFELLRDYSLQLDQLKRGIVTALPIGVNNLQTNDCLELVGERGFRFLGRSDRVINRDGIKIHPEQIEMILEPEINSPFLVVALTDQTYGELPGILIERSNQTSEPIPAYELNRFNAKLKSTGLGRIHELMQGFYLSQLERTPGGKLRVNPSLNGKFLI
jgi:O-succinylbenzoic acid--CoA ligase